MSDTYNASNRRHVMLAEKEAKGSELIDKEVVLSLMTTTNGRKWMHDRLSEAHIFASSFQLNALGTAFAEGERSQGLRLLNQIMLFCPDQYVLMMREENARASTSSERRRKSAEPTDPSSGDGDTAG
jgi:hypothetical protein